MVPRSGLPPTPPPAVLPLLGFRSVTGGGGASLARPRLMTRCARPRVSDGWPLLSHCFQQRALPPASPLPLAAPCSVYVVRTGKLNNRQALRLLCRFQAPPSLAFRPSSTPRPRLASVASGWAGIHARPPLLSRALMAQRVHVVRVEGRLATPMPFVALRSCAGGVVASTSDSIDLARLLIAWTQLGQDAGLVFTFETHGATSSWLTSSPPPLPEWAAHTCTVSDDDDVVILDEVSESSPSFVLLRLIGGQLAAEADASQIPRLVNTIKDLNGEVVVVRMLSSMGDAEGWLKNPRMPKWLFAPAAVFPTSASTD